ncbi:MAG TPA: TIGR00730 family Rossman fold protein [Alphaproteobacteria bacterium]
MGEVRSVCVYCGASGRVAKRYLDAAAAMGRGLAERRLRLVFGGGHVGLMGVMADAALAAGGEVHGVIPRHLMDRELGHGGLTRLHVVASMHERKQRMFDLADAFVALPGGVGTLDETIEVLTWKQLGMHDKPIVLLNLDGYWDRFVELIEAVIGEGFAPPATARLFATEPTVEAVFETLARAPGPALAPDSARF